MKRFLFKISLFSIPFVLYLLLVAVADPFNYLNGTGIIDPALRAEIANETEPHLYKMIAFEHAPKKNIALGDSRTNGLFQFFPTENWANMAYDGASIREIVETFWWLEPQIKMDTVLIGINLRQYNAYHKRAWVSETIERKSNFFSYAFSSYTFNATMGSLRNYFGGQLIPTQQERPKDEFWQYQLNSMAPKFFERFAYPQEYHDSLMHISEHCQKNDITLIFWIPPTHDDFHKVVESYGLSKDRKRFLNDLCSMGQVYDFDQPGPLTSDKENFRDPVHFTKEKGAQIYQEIMYNAPNYSKFYPGPSGNNR